MDVIAPIAVCIFAKPPVPGRVNTRLAPALGEAGAASLARAFLADTLALVTGTPWARPILATTGPMPPDLTSAHAVENWDQGDGDLGDRMERVLARALESHPAAIALGVDAPTLDPPALDRIRGALSDHDAAVGPTPDGGYYTLALRRCEPGLLAGLPWSAPTTREATVARLRDRGLRVAILDEAFDVDEPADLDRLLDALRRDPAIAPHTRAALADLGRRP